MNRFLDTVNSARMKLLKIIICAPNAQTSNDTQNGLVRTYMRSCYVRMPRRKVKYLGDASAETPYFNYGVAVVPYDAFGTLQTDIVGTFAYMHNLYFNDP